jgi:hypothetical protein
MQGKPINIPLESLDTAPGPYTMSFGFDPEPMIESIRKVGVLNPPLVDRDEEGRVRIVAGYRRIVALKALGQGESACIDLSVSGMSLPFKLLLNLHDNLATRVFNGVEKGMALERLLAHFPEQEVIERYMPLLGLPAHGPLLWTYVGIGRLEEDVRLAFVEGRLSFQSVRAMLDMEIESRNAFCEWLLALSFNFNQQAQLIDLAMDLSSITGVTAAQVLSEGELRRILENSSLNGPQKVKSIIDTLRSRRLPKLVTAEKAFQRRIRDLRLPEGVRVQHSPSFEAPDFRLEISFRDGKILRQKIEDLTSVKGLEEIRDPWED